MNCVYHLDHPASGQCQGCGRGLCIECLHASRPPGICYDCLLVGNRQRRDHIIGLLIKTAIAATVGAIGVYWLRSAMDSPDTALNVLIGIYLGVAFFWGRHTLRRVTQGHGGLVLLAGASVGKEPGLGVLFGIIAGLLLWLVIGTISAPIELTICVIRLVRLHKGSDAIRRVMPRPLIAT